MYVYIIFMFSFLIVYTPNLFQKNIIYLLIYLFVLVISGPSILDEHCIIENNDGFVLLEPFPDATCSVNGTALRKRVRLQQGKYLYFYQQKYFNK